MVLAAGLYAAVVAGLIETEVVPGGAGAAAMFPFVGPKEVERRDPASDLGADNGSLPEFFSSFDADLDGRLAREEAREFFFWVERNIAYRYDNEQASPTAGAAVGDGRPGADYQQTVEETLRERAGDCEDQSALEVAFYLHWKIPAYVAMVNARSSSTYDHAVAIVRAGESLDELRALVGDVPYYEIRGRAGVEDGYYVIVDNTYSRDFGVVSGGIGAQKFQIHQVRSYADLFEATRLTPVMPQG